MYEFYDNLFHHNSYFLQYSTYCYIGNLLLLYNQYTKENIVFISMLLALDYYKFVSWYDL